MIERDSNPEASYQQLFQKAASEFAMIMEDGRVDDLGVRQVMTELFDCYVTFFQNESKKTFGVHFEREGSIKGDTEYSFSQDGKVLKTGWVGRGDDEYPSVIYGTGDDEISGVDRKPPIEVSLEDLELLTDFIEHPLRSRQSFEYLKSFPNEQEILNS